MANSNCPFIQYRRIRWLRDSCSGSMTGSRIDYSNINRCERQNWKRPKTAIPNFKGIIAHGTKSNLGIPKFLESIPVKGQKLRRIMSDKLIRFRFPPYDMKSYTCPSFLPRETRNTLRGGWFIGTTPQIIIVGGGGSAKSGVKNVIVRIWESRYT